MVQGVTEDVLKGLLGRKELTWVIKEVLQVCWVVLIGG